MRWGFSLAGAMVVRSKYTEFFLFSLGSMIHWPTLITLLTLPILWWVYLRLARMEERDAINTFGNRYRKYMSQTGRFVPLIGKCVLSIRASSQSCPVFRVGIL